MRLRAWCDPEQPHAKTLLADWVVSSCAIITDQLQTGRTAMCRLGDADDSDCRARARCWADSRSPKLVVAKATPLTMWMSACG